MPVSEMPLLNLQDYTGPQLAFYATGAYLWVVAYLIYIRNGFKYRVVEMPAFAACSNIGWEVNWAPNMKSKADPSSC